ncbi:hypothetical protein [Clostridium thermarum]|uniref:hypothetical protein n=1 Tax=Clostridium thermarum TaxID=1716543 RepID=UPI0013D5D01E|nr:hypothetical protein [Clostridium thermarum]
MAIHKCKKCIWSNKISSNILFCIFPKCIVKEEIPEQAVGAKETSVVPKARTTCDDKRKRSKRHVSKKTKKTL